jgi:hypothetical protein
MSKPKSNTESSNKPQPKTQAEFYEHAWKVVFNKLSKEEQAYLTANIAKPYPIVRGVPQPDAKISRFIKNVAELGEEMFDKSSKVVSKAA